MNKIYFLFFIALMLSSCQSAKDALTLKKKPSGDEFLVEKKNPLVMPPNYGKLPMPEEKNDDKNFIDENEIQLIITNDSNVSSKIKKSTEPTSLEKSILEKIQ
jgi:hypothetical protein